MFMIKCHVDSLRDTLWRSRSIGVSRLKNVLAQGSFKTQGLWFRVYTGSRDAGSRSRASEVMV